MEIYIHSNKLYSQFIYIINIFASNQQNKLLHNNYFLHVKYRSKSTESWLTEILAPVRQISKYPIVSVGPGLLPVFLYSHIMWLDKQTCFLYLAIYLLLATSRLCELTAAANTNSAEARYFNNLLELICKCCRYYKIYLSHTHNYMHIFSLYDKDNFIPELSTTFIPNLTIAQKIYKIPFSSSEESFLLFVHHQIRQFQKQFIFLSKLKKTFLDLTALSSCW